MPCLPSDAISQTDHQKCFAAPAAVPCCENPPQCGRIIVNLSDATDQTMDLGDWSEMRFVGISNPLTWDFVTTRPSNGDFGTTLLGGC